MVKQIRLRKSLNFGEESAKAASGKLTALVFMRKQAEDKQSILFYN